MTMRFPIHCNELVRECFRMPTMFKDRNPVWAASFKSRKKNWPIGSVVRVVKLRQPYDDDDALSLRSEQGDFPESLIGCIGVVEAYCRFGSIKVAFSKQVEAVGLLRTMEIVVSPDSHKLDHHGCWWFYTEELAMVEKAKKDALFPAFSLDKCTNL